MEISPITSKTADIMHLNRPASSADLRQSGKNPAVVQLRLEDLITDGKRVSKDAFRFSRHRQRSSNQDDILDSYATATRGSRLFLRAKANASTGNLLNGPATVARTASLSPTESSSETAESQYEEKDTPLVKAKRKSKYVLSRIARSARNSTKPSALDVYNSAMDRAEILDVNEEVETGQLETSDSSRPTSSVRERHISAPFGFQHVIHTSRQSLTSLKGVAAEDDDTTAEAPTIKRCRDPRSGLGPPQRYYPSHQQTGSLEILQSDSRPPIPPLSHLRFVRSSENLPREFQSVSEVYQNSQPPFQPPPRSSSRRRPYLPRTHSHSYINDAHMTPPRSLSPSPIEDQVNPPRSPLFFDHYYENQASPKSPMSTDEFPHALTTPYDQAVPAVSQLPIPQRPLEDVPEEPETPVSARSSSCYSRSQTSTPHRRIIPYTSQETQTSPVQVKPSIMESPNRPPRRPRPESQMSDTLGIYDGRRRSVRVSQQAAVSTTDPAESMENSKESWEDDIDFCYEHEAEADCDFDWSNVSRLDLGEDEGPVGRKRLARTVSGAPSAGSSSLGRFSSASAGDGTSFRSHSSMSEIPSKDSVPDLDHELMSTYTPSTISFRSSAAHDLLNSPGMDVPGARRTRLYLHDSQVRSTFLLLPDDPNPQRSSGEVYETFFAEHGDEEQIDPHLGAAIASRKQPREDPSPLEMHDDSQADASPSSTDTVRLESANKVDDNADIQKRPPLAVRTRSDSSVPASVPYTLSLFPSPPRSPKTLPPLLARRMASNPKP